MLWKKSSYLDRSITHLVNREIYEYDMQSAGLNVTIFYKLLPEEELKRLLSISSKKELVVELGLLQRSNPEYKKALREGFADARRLFFESNQLQEEDILSIKSDAIYTLRPCGITEFDNLHFVCKNYYTSYHRYGKYEHYFGGEKLDIKGLSEEKLELHRHYLLSFLRDFYRRMELSSQRDHTIKSLMEFIEAYQRRQLHVNYYRELNDRNLFLRKEGKEYVYSNTCYSVLLLDITYNFMEYLVELSKYYFRLA